MENKWFNDPATRLEILWNSTVVFFTVEVLFGIVFVASLAFGFASFSLGIACFLAGIVTIVLSLSGFFYERKVKSANLNAEIAPINLENI